MMYQQFSTGPTCLYGMIIITFKIFRLWRKKRAQPWYNGDVDLCLEVQGMSKKQDLEALCTEWMAAQGNEPAESLAKTMLAGVRNIPANSFCKDGIVCEEVFDQQPVKVLFITNEENLEDYFQKNDCKVVRDRNSNFNAFYSDAEDFGGRLMGQICSMYQVLLGDY